MRLTSSNFFIYFSNFSTSSPILQKFCQQFFSFVSGTTECCMFFRIRRLADDQSQKISNLPDTTRIYQIIVEIFLFQRPQNAVISSKSIERRKNDMICFKTLGIAPWGPECNGASSNCFIFLTNFFCYVQFFKNLTRIILFYFSYNTMLYIPQNS